MVAVGAVVGAPPQVGALAVSGIARVEDQPHVAIGAGEVGLGVVAVPVAVLPLVVLVLPLDQAEAVERLGDELLVAGAAVLGRAQQIAVVVGQMLARIGADQEVGDPARGSGRAFAEVLERRRQHVVGVAALVDRRDRVAGDARDAFVHSRRREALRVQVLGAGEQRDRVVTAGAVAGLGGFTLLGEAALHLLEGRVHGGEPVSARLPLLEDLLVAARRAAGARARQQLGLDQAQVVGAGEGGGEGVAAILVELLGVGGQAVALGDRHTEVAARPGERDGDHDEAGGGQPHEGSAREGRHRSAQLAVLPGHRPPPNDRRDHVGEDQRQGGDAGHQVDQIPELRDS